LGGRGHSGQVPVGQLPELPEDDSPDLAENVEKTFSVSEEPHCSQGCFRRLPDFSRKELTCPHFLHRYSNIGIVTLP
jgi:hypothetical protein